MYTLGELVESFQLYAVCEPCQRVVWVDVARIIRDEGAGYEIQRLRHRLFCSCCQTRTRAIRIVYVGTNAKASGFRYRRTASPLPDKD